MNKIFLLVVCSLILASSGLTQDFGRQEGHFKRRAPIKKIEELEKIKLLEVMNLDEAVAAKLITRRSQDRAKIWDIEDKINSVLENIENEVNKGKDKDISKIQKLNESYLNLNMEIEKEKQSFLRSLPDILNTEQIGKYIVFERKFREEIRDLLMKERMRRNKGK